MDLCTYSKDLSPCIVVHHNNKITQMIIQNAQDLLPPCCQVQKSLSQTDCICWLLKQCRFPPLRSLATLRLPDFPSLNKPPKILPQIIITNINISPNNPSSHQSLVNVRNVLQHLILRLRFMLPI